jgi:hypothetical protein
VKTFRIAAVMVLLAGPVHAQALNIPNLIPDTPSKTPEQIEKEQAIERDYKEGLKKIPDGKASNDPWGNVRSADAPAASAKTATARAPKIATPKTALPKTALPKTTLPRTATSGTATAPAKPAPIKGNAAANPQ